MHANSLILGAYREKLKCNKYKQADSEKWVDFLQT